MKKITLLILFIGGAIGSSVLLYFNLNTLFIVTITITTILLLCLIKGIFEEKTPESIYDKTLRNLIKTYEPILIDVEKTPELDVKNIIITSSFEKMVDVQYELKKPIFYKMSINSCSFILLDTDIAYVYILRVTDDSFSPLDDIITSIEMDNKKRRKDKKILDDIDKTTIIKLDDCREFKVSPVRKRDVTAIEDITIVNEEAVEKVQEKNQNSPQSKKKKKKRYYNPKYNNHQQKNK